MPSDIEKVKEIRIFPERDLKIMRAVVKLVKEGKDPIPYRIQKITGVPQGKVKERLQRIEEYRFMLLDFAREVRKTRYWQQKWQQSWAKKVGPSYVEWEKQMLRQGIWPLGGPKPYGCIYDEEKKTLFLDPDIKLQEFFKRCANGEVPHSVARELGIPKHQVGNLLDSATYKGFFLFGGESFPFPQLAATDTETWEKAHKLHQYWASHGKKRPRAPTFTKWVSNKLVPDDPDNKLRQLCDLRLKKYGCPTIAKKLRINSGTVYKALKRKSLYVELGMVDAETWERVRLVHVDLGEAARREDRFIKRDILNFLRKEPLRFKEIVQKTGLSNTTVWKHLRQLKEKGRIDKEPEHSGKWYTKPEKTKS
jgi:DNA invertase Pin-like site-specific DNA recombinase